MPSVGVFIRDSSSYLKEFRRKPQKIPNGLVDKCDRRLNKATSFEGRTVWPLVGLIGTINYATSSTHIRFHSKLGFWITFKEEKTVKTKYFYVLINCILICMSHSYRQKHQVHFTIKIRVGWNFFHLCLILNSVWNTSYNIR